MKKFSLWAMALAMASFTFYSCDDQQELAPAEEVSQDVLNRLTSLGFNVEDQKVITFDQGYLVEGDIYLTDKDIARLTPGDVVPTAEQYRTNELVCGTRTITMYAAEGGKSGYSPAMIAGLDEAISRYNAMNLALTFQRITTSNADIVMTRLSKGEERRGILGSAGFPSNCEPYGEIKMSGILESNYGLSVDGIATIIAHEMGHCIGFRHTDYFDRSISCGGSASNEGASTVGAVHIPGTPTGADPSTDLSWMLACTDGGNRPFTSNDQTALDYLY